MEFLTRFARSLQRAPAVPLDAVVNHEQASTNDEGIPTLPVFKTALRPTTGNTTTTSLPPKLTTPAKFKQKSVLAPKPAGILKSKPRTTLLTSEITTKLKDPFNIIEIKVPQATPKETSILSSAPAPAPVPPRRITPQPAFTSPYKKTQQQAQRSPSVQITAPEHPLSLAFKDTTQTYTTSLLATLPTLLHTHTATLSSALSATHTLSASYITAFDASTARLTHPLHETGLVVTWRRGLPDERRTETTLGAQMGAFGNAVDVFEKRIQGLRKSWEEVQGRLEVLGAGVSDESVKGGYAAEAARLRGEYVKSRGEVVKVHAEGCRKLADEVKADQKKYETKRAMIAEQVMKFLKSQADDDDDGGEDEEAEEGSADDRGAQDDEDERDGIACVDVFDANGLFVGFTNTSIA